MKPALGLVVALAAEGRALLGTRGWLRAGGRRVRDMRLPDGTRLLCARSGVGADRALSAARWLVGEGVTALAVIGVSGGLDPSLESGDLVVAETVLEYGGGAARREWSTDAVSTGLLHATLAAESLPVRRGAVIAASRAVLTTEGKGPLHGRWGALAVDLESAAVARAASEWNLPLVVLRAVCDTADQSIPPDLLDALDGDGGVSPSILLRRLARRPPLAFDLLRMERAFSAALDSLRRAWRAQNRAGLPARITPR